MRAWCGLAAEAAARGWAADVRECRWTNTFRTHRRLASRDGRRRVLLIGDAAHVCSPIGGQGLNLGLRDAVSLAEVLPAATACGQHGRRAGCPRPHRPRHPRLDPALGARPRRTGHGGTRRPHHRGRPARTGRGGRRAPPRTSEDVPFPRRLTPRVARRRTASVPRSVGGVPVTMFLS
ncbi:FAD-dependent monooxygenase [Streptomyces nojiriensis]|uniref:FAD-dependent monooxygenase n=1 Tax=Streptomyces nojiriensis TaxID=66374 RepID=UPI0035D8E984